MFEALLTLCLPEKSHSCRDVLLPGYEARKQEDCQNHARSSPMDWSRLFPDYLNSHLPHCSLQKPPSMHFQEVATGLHVHRGIINDANPHNLGDVANLGFVIGSDSIAVIDAGGSRLVGENLFRAIRKISPLPITYLILTHMHPDHVLGASVFAETGTKIVGHHKLSRALQELGPRWIRNFGSRIGAKPFIGTKISSPHILVSDTLHLNLGKRMLILKARKAAHTETDLSIHDTQSHTMFTGDLVFDEHSPALDGSIKGWRKILAQLQQHPDITHIIPGHGGPVLDWPNGAQPLERYLDTLEQETRKAIQQGTPLHQAMHNVARSEQSQWKLFNLFHPRNVTRAYTELEWE